MKKIISLMTALSMSTIAVTTTIACNNSTSNAEKYLKTIEELQNKVNLKLNKININEFEKNKLLELRNTLNKLEKAIKLLKNSDEIDEETDEGLKIALELLEDQINEQ